MKTDTVNTINDKKKQCSKILFIAPYDYGSFAIRTLRSILKEKGYSTEIIFFKELLFNKIKKPSQKEISLLLWLIRTIDPSIICISVRSPFFEIMKKVTLLIKRNTNCEVIWGGTHATVCPEECIKYVDYVCIGEGELSLLEFVEKFTENKPISNILNFWIKTKKGVIKNQIRPLLQELDKLPMVDYSNKNKYFIENNEINRGEPLLNNSRYYIMAGRGCPFSCTYCTNSFFHKLFNGKGQYVRFRSVKNVIDELKYVKKKFKNLKEIYFVDEVFVINKEWISEFVIEYKKEIGLDFGCEFYPSTVDEDIIKKLNWAGLTYVTMGIQSGSQRVRSVIFKRFTSDEQILNAAKIFKNYKIMPYYDLILDNPYETREDMVESIKFILKIPRPYNLNIYSLVNFPKTDLTNMLVNDLIITSSNSEKALTQWRMSFNFKRTNMQNYYNSIVSLLSKQFIPKRFIVWILRNHYLIKNPQPLMFFSDICNKIKIIFSGISMIIMGKVSYKSFKYYLKNFTREIIM